MPRLFDFLKQNKIFLFYFMKVIRLFEAPKSFVDMFAFLSQISEKKVRSEVKF